jgi:hypothetical protein
MGIPDLGGQKIDLTGLVEVVKSAVLEGLLCRIQVPMACEHDHRNIGVDLLDLGQSLMAVHARHLDVEDHHVLGFLPSAIPRASSPLPAIVVSYPFLVRILDVVERNCSSSSTMSTLILSSITHAPPYPKALKNPDLILLFFLHP